MDFGLLGILAAQQVEKPDFTGGLQNTLGRSAPNNNEPSFKERLEATEQDIRDKLPTTETVKNRVKDTVNDVGNEVAHAEAPIEQIVADNAPAQAADALPKNIEDAVEDAVDTLQTQIINFLQNAPQVTNAATSNASDTLQEHQQQLIQAFNALKQAQDNGANEGKANPLTTLLTAQEAGNTDDIASALSEIISSDGLSDADAIKKLQELLQKIAGNDALPKDITDTASAILALLASVQPQPITTAANSQDSSGSLNAIAGDILQIAKAQAQAPEVVESDVKSDQVLTLLQGAKENDGGQNTQKQTVADKTQAQDAAQHKTTPNLDGLQAALQTQQNQIDNKTASNDRLVQNVIDTANLNAKTVLASAQADSNSDQSHQDTNPLAQVSLTANAGASQNQDFIKFQKYITSLDTSTQQNQLANFAKAEDVLAQIKFGTHSLIGKNESSISIQLHPKELGSVDIRMEISADGKTKIAIMAEKTDTLNLLQKEAGSLKAMLQDALQTDSAQMNFSFHGQNDDQWKQFINESFNRPYGNSNEEEEVAPLPSLAYRSGLIASEGLDIRV